MFNVTRDTIDNRDKTFADVGNAGFSVSIKKTPVTISLPLEYIKDVPFDYREEIYEYSRWEAGRNPGKFCYENTISKCSEDDKLATHPSGKPLAWAHGRCCWCSEVLAFTHINNMKRGNFRCNWFELVFARSLWVTKSCPRTELPWYSMLRINDGKQWTFSLEVELRWWTPPRALQLITSKLFDECEAGKAEGTVPADRDCVREKHERAGMTSRVYTLNFTSPEIFDRKRL
ncbi:male gamete fusion factor [Cystoisospora suis]|uniref:Male gamete fusion factor n=1 Tax=Cystoisospora suis TaxID=483139 RepID=A0A2C6LG11_9APIC|nr:male gamete fusion factor [Cystoisospora suis]